jgi:dihydrofolate synthase/folylpolyglutamate synthase
LSPPPAEPPAAMDFRDALRDLDSRQSESMPHPGLDRISELAKLLDHPESKFPSIHVTGTNGKTTTTRMITALACAHGLTTGSFISPHVTAVTERLSSCGREISPEEFAEEYERLLPYFRHVDGPSGRVTYFEALTAMAYLWFADKPVELAVFEVGMGGTWDATNLIRGDVAVLCPIGVDHKELGSTPAETAVEKAGIIKEGRRAVVREQRPEVLEVIRARCDEVGAELLLEGAAFDVDRRPAVGGQSLDIRGLHGSYQDVFLPMFGEQLARNAGAAVAAVEALLGRSLGESAVRGALLSVASPGRVEVVGRHPLVVLDGAHNPDAMASLVQALTESFRWERLHLVMAMFEDKDVEAVTGLIAPITARGYACRNASPRSAPPDRVAAGLRAAGLPYVQEYASVGDALGAARQAADRDDLILVTGSFYTVADARPLLVGA